MKKQVKKVIDRSYVNRNPKIIVIKNKVDVDIVSTLPVQTEEHAEEPVITDTVVKNKNNKK